MMSLVKQKFIAPDSLFPIPILCFLSLFNILRLKDLILASRRLSSLAASTEEGM